MTRLMNIRSCDMMIDWSSYVYTEEFTVSLLTFTYLYLSPFFLFPLLEVKPNLLICVSYVSSVRKNGMSQS